MAPRQARPSEHRPDNQLGTLQALVIRAYAERYQQQTGQPIGHMRFGTASQARALNVAYGGERSTSGAGNVVKRGAQGLGFDLAEPPSDTVSVGRDKVDKAGNPVLDAGGGVVREYVDVPRDEAKLSARQREAEGPTVLYHINNLHIDKRPDRCGAQANYDENGTKIAERKSGRGPAAEDALPTLKSGDALRDENGKPVMNHDENGQEIQARVGDIKRGEDGRVIKRAVHQLAPRQLDPPAQQVENLMAKGGKIDDLRDQLQQEGFEALEIKQSNAQTAQRATFHVVEKDGKEIPTITLPKGFDTMSDDNKLREVARAVSHVSQFQDAGSPNHDNAREAAKLTPAKQPTSAAYAACELTAQHAAVNVVTRHGGVHQPQAASFNDKMREAWAKQMESPEGLKAFAKATDRATRVAGGLEPDIPAQVKLKERHAELGRDAARNERAAQGRGVAGQQRTSIDLSDMAVPTPGGVRGAGQAAGGGVTAAKGQTRGGQDKGDTAPPAPGD